MHSPQRIQVDLAVVIDRQLYDLAGHHLYCMDAPSSSDQITVRLDDREAPRFVLQKGLGLNVPFRRFYLSTPTGQTGAMTLMIGADAPETHLPIDNRTAAADLLADQLTALQSIDGKL